MNESDSPLDWHKILPFQADAASDRLGLVGLGGSSLPRGARF